MNSSRLRKSLVTGLVLLLAGLVGCSQFAASSGSAPEMGRVGDGAVPQATTVPTGAEPDTGGDRSIVRTGALTLRGDDVTALADRLRQLAERLGGFVASEHVRTTADSGASSSKIVFSVPADSMDAFMAEAGTYAELVTRSVTATDVTAQVVDVEARIRTLRESIERIRKLMDKAGSISDIARVEAELTNRQAELESLLAQQKALTNAVDRAPITVSLVRPGQVTSDNPLLTGLARSWDALQQSIVVLLTLIGGLLPFLLVFGLILWPFFNRLRKRRFGAHKVDPDTSVSATPDNTTHDPSDDPKVPDDGRE